MLNPNRVLSKAQILDHVWEYNFNGDAYIVESYTPTCPQGGCALQRAAHQSKGGIGYRLKAVKAWPQLRA